MTPRVGDANWANQAIWTGDTSARLWGLPDLVDMVDHADADEGVEHRATRRTFHPSPAPQTGVSTNSTTPEVSYPKSTAGHLAWIHRRVCGIDGLGPGGRWAGACVRAGAFWGVQDWSAGLVRLVALGVGLRCAGR